MGFDVLDIVGGKDRRVPYLYSVPDKIRRYYKQDL